MKKSIMIIIVLILLMSCSSISRSQSEIDELQSHISNIVSVLSTKSSKEDIYLVNNPYNEKSAEWSISDYFIKKIRVEATKENNLTIVTRDSFKEIIEEFRFQYGENSNENTLEFANFYNANKIVTVKFIDNSVNIEIYLEVVDIESSKITSFSELIPKDYRLKSQLNNVIYVQEEYIKESELRLEMVKEEIANEQKRLNELYEKGIQDIKIKIQKEEKEKETELLELERQIKEKSEILSNYNYQYSMRQNELRSYDEKIDAIIGRIDKQDDLVSNYIVNGMTVQDVERVLGISIDSYDLQMSMVDMAFFGVSSVFGAGSLGVQVGNYIVVFSGMYKVIGYYDLVSEEGYYRSTR